MAEPQITDIASQLAARLPEPGADPAVAREGWCRALRLARELGDVTWITTHLARRAPEDASLRARCEALGR